MYSKKANKKEAGQGLVEYALILVLVSIVVIVVLAVLGPTTGNIFSNIVDAIGGDLSGVGGGGGSGDPCVDDPTTAGCTSSNPITGNAARTQYCAERPGYSGGVNWGFAGGHLWQANETGTVTANDGLWFFVTGDPFNCSDYLS